MTSTNVSSGTLNITGITCSSLLNTGLISSNNLYASISTLPNLISTNITTTGLATNSLYVTDLDSTNNLYSTTSTIDNAILTNISSGTINLSSGITSSSLLVTGLI